MNKFKVWTSIALTGVIASITASAGFFPDLKIILVAAAALVSAILAFVVSR